MPDPLSPTGRFAMELRRMLDRTPGLTIRDLAVRVNYSHSTVSEALGGKKLPSWPVTEALVRAGGEGGGPLASSIPWWRTLWQTARNDADAPRSVPAELLDHGVDWRPPRPEIVRTFDDLAHELQCLRTMAGSPSLRALHKRTVYYVQRSQSTIGAIFAHGRRPEFEMLRALLLAMLPRAVQLHPATGETDPSWRHEEQWYEAWNRAEFNHRYRDACVEPRRRAVTLPVEGLSPRDVEEVVADLPEETITVLLTVLRRRHPPGGEPDPGNTAGAGTSPR
ncbi:helix-turn-helix domain-containing protein [Nocardia cyriacigeorgica]|uniref:helix-turn-helix domain-containing protein n=1 Tax=Nocardia cyriacigeorgica TaxID=135487 RepID=UPI00131A44DA|nr:helix-turn-helix transcriptional regulator [Nocardia cyriacigeorgica]